MNWFDQLSGRLSPDGFARRLIEQLEEAGDTRRVTFDAPKFQLRFKVQGREVGYANLQNLYDEYLTYSGRDKSEFFRAAVRSLLASQKPIPDDFSDARCDIFVTLRNRSYFSMLELSHWVADDHEFSWPYQPIAEHLAAGLSYDLPEAMVMLQAEHLDEWGVTFYEGYESALANLAELDASFTTIDDHSYVSSTGDHYDASRMLLPELIAELEVLGDPVVMLPNRDRMLVTGAADRSGLETVAIVTQQLLTHPRPVSGIAFRWHDEEWHPWLPEPSHSAFSTLKRLMTQTMQQDYQEQTSLLRKWHHKQGLITDVAEYKVHGAGGKKPPTSYCVWQEGSATLLPETDRICFLNSTQSLDHPLVEGINCSWASAREVMRDAMHEESHYPTRFRVESYPSKAQLAELKRLSG